MTAGCSCGGFRGDKHVTFVTFGHGTADRLE